MKPIILSTEASAYFAELIAKKLPAAESIGITRKLFGDGERYLRIESSERLMLMGRDIIFVASVVTDQDLHEVCRLGAALAKYGARRVIYVIPFEGYTTMERAVKPLEVVTAKVIARQLSQIPSGDLRNAFLFMDLHTAGFVHYFEGECFRDEIYGQDILVEAIRALDIKNLMFGTADLGRVRWAKAYARLFGTRIAMIDKDRDFESTHVDAVIGDVAGMTVVIQDDMTRSAGSLIKGAEAYFARGAIGVYAVVSHLALNHDEVIDLIQFSPLKGVIATNSHPMTQRLRPGRSSKITVVDASQLFIGHLQRLIQR